jgi:hypothetical protein
MIHLELKLLRLDGRQNRTLPAINPLFAILVGRPHRRNNARKVRLVVGGQGAGFFRRSGLTAACSQMTKKPSPSCAGHQYDYIIGT